MKKFMKKSLSFKISLLIVLVSSLVIMSIFFISERFNKEAFYSVELDKANIILKTIEPLVALDIYLGIDTNIKKIAQDLMKNPNILSLTITKDSQKIYSIQSPSLKQQEAFLSVTQDILQPNTKKKIGTISLDYSSQNYQKLINNYRKFTLILAVVLVVLFLLLSVYIQKLLSPLRSISNALKNYQPNQEVDIPFVEENNEIGLISKALLRMQKKIIEHTKEQQNINEDLEKLVNIKTLELQTQLYTNNLTKLPNRLSLLKSISLLEEKSLIIINIDDFKEINDFYGHAIGDDILKQFANKLQELTRYISFRELTHLHADEFALLIKIKLSKDDFVKIIQKITSDIEHTLFVSDENTINLRITIGAVFNDKDPFANTLEKADIALKLAKKKGIPYLVYDKNLGIEEQYKTNMQWVHKLKDAFVDDAIVPFYQPIYDNATQKIASCECLVRLIDKDGKVISPFAFLTVAKKSRLYTNITKTMIQKSCHYFKNLHCDFSINLSIDDMLNNETIRYLQEQIHYYDVANKITIEILETEGIENYEEISAFLMQMKEMGCKIAIDDFGSGYSSFEYLLKLHVDYIKIDGTLIKNIDTDTNSAIVVETIVNFAKKLGILTIAEFVHSQEVFEKVKQLGVDRSQGFYLCEPRADIKDLL